MDSFEFDAFLAGSFVRFVVNRTHLQQMDPCELKFVATYALLHAPIGEKVRQKYI